MEYAVERNDGTPRVDGPNLKAIRPGGGSNGLMWDSLRKKWDIGRWCKSEASPGTWPCIVLRVFGPHTCCTPSWRLTHRSDLSRPLSVAEGGPHPRLQGCGMEHSSSSTQSDNPVREAVFRASVCSTLLRGEDLLWGKKTSLIQIDCVWNLEGEGVVCLFFLRLSLFQYHHRFRSVVLTKQIRQYAGCALFVCCFCSWKTTRWVSRVPPSCAVSSLKKETWLAVKQAASVLFRSASLACTSQGWWSCCSECAWLLREHVLCFPPPLSLFLHFKRKYSLRAR